MNHLNKHDLEQILDSKDRFLYCVGHQMLFRKNPSKVSKEALLDYVLIGYVKPVILHESNQVNYCRCQSKDICKYGWFD